MTVKKKKKRKMTAEQKAYFHGPLNPSRNTEKIIPKSARMGLKAK